MWDLTCVTVVTGTLLCTVAICHTNDVAHTRYKASGLLLLPSGIMTLPYLKVRVACIN